RPLLVQGQREPEVEELAGDARSARRDPGLLLHAARGGRDERGRGGARCVAGELEPGERPAPDRVEVDDGDDVEGRMRGEPKGAEAAERAGVRGQEDDRVA